MKNKAEPNSESPEGLARRLAEGICGWMTFAQASKRYQIYSEHMLYAPIYELVSGRKWSVQHQVKLRRFYKGIGKKPALDFVFKTDNDIVLVEVKFFKPWKKSPVGLTKDMARLARLTGDDLNEGIDITRFILVVGIKRNVLDRIGGEDSRVQKQVSDMLDIEDLSAETSIGVVRTAPKDRRYAYSALMLSGQPRWKKLKISKKKSLLHRE